MANDGFDRPRKVESDGLAFRLYDLAVGEEDARLCRDIPDAQCREQPSSFLLQVAAQALSKTGDALADTKVVLPWLLGAVGAPLFLVGLLVPIRRSLALMPQMLVGGMIRRFAVRKGFWVASSVVEGLCVIAMGIVAVVGLRGATAGWAIVALLVVFSLARGVASIAAKDTLGKTVSKGKRGRVGGYSEMASGLVATAVGLYLVLSPEAARPAWALYAMVIAGGLAFLLAASTFWTIDEHPGATEGGRGLGDLLRGEMLLLLRDRELQNFLVARTLLISTALVGPVYVSLAQRGTGETLDGLGWLVLAAGFASAVSSTFWGKRADASSRRTMAAAAFLAGVLGLGVLATLALIPRLGHDILFYAAILFILGVSHAGVRIGRKTQLIDLAGGDRRSEYVALSNTIIGVLLLAIGAGVSVLLSFGLELAVGVLSVMSVLGAVMALRMKHVQG